MKERRSRLLSSRLERKSRYCGDSTESCFGRRIAATRCRRDAKEALSSGGEEERLLAVEWWNRGRRGAMEYRFTVRRPSKHSPLRSSLSSFRPRRMKNSFGGLQNFTRTHPNQKLRQGPPIAIYRDEIDEMRDVEVWPVAWNSRPREVKSRECDVSPCGTLQGGVQNADLSDESSLSLARTSGMHEKQMYNCSFPLSISL